MVAAWQSLRRMSHISASYPSPQEVATNRFLPRVAKRSGGTGEERWWRSRYPPESNQTVAHPMPNNMSENRRWLSIADLVGPFDNAKIAMIGAPLGQGSLTPGRCDLGPPTIRAALKRLSTYDIETETDLAN